MPSSCELSAKRYNASHPDLSGDISASNHPFPDMSRQLDESQSSERLGSCATLLAGIKHVEQASAFEADDEEKKLLEELQAWNGLSCQTGLITFAGTCRP